MTTIATPRRSTPIRRLWRGRTGDPAWTRPALLVLLGLSALAFCWGLSASGYANQFYSAAAQAGGASWKAFFFGSLDAGNAITVDKPPAALWPMALSVRLFGLNSWAILLPQALMGVASVGAVYATVRRGFGPVAGLLSGTVFALTPVAALMFRFNNPDALLCLLSVSAIYCVVRAVEAGRTRWLVAAGALLGLAFLVKTLQAWLIVPVLAIVYLVYAPVRWPRRLWQLAAAGAAMVVGCGWWIAIVELWPASSRPYVGGSQSNSFLELTFGYNGFGRITGDEAGSVGGGRGWGSSGLARLFDATNGGQIAWLLPAAVVLLFAALYLLRRNRCGARRWRRGGSGMSSRRVPADSSAPDEVATAPAGRAGARSGDGVGSRLLRRTREQSAQLWLWGGSLLVTALVFSFMAGIFHEYYSVALAPYVAAVVGIGATVLWRRRRFPAVAAVLAAVVAGVAVWGFVLLGRTQWLAWLSWMSGLRWIVLAAGLAAAIGLLLARRLPRRVVAAAGVLALVAALAGPFVYTVYTVATPHSGSIVTAGPATADTLGGPGMRQVEGGQPGKGGPPPGGKGDGGRGGDGGPGGENGPRGMGGLLNGQSVSAELARLLAADAEDYTWIAATSGSQNASSFQLATEQPVLAIGGFNGSDPSPTLAQFKNHVADGAIHYYVATEELGPDGQGGSAADIAEWVADNFAKRTVDGVTVYDLSG